MAAQVIHNDNLILLLYHAPWGSFNGLVRASKVLATYYSRHRDAILAHLLGVHGTIVVCGELGAPCNFAAWAFPTGLRHGRAIMRAHDDGCRTVVTYRMGVPMIWSVERSMGDIPIKWDILRQGTVSPMRSYRRFGSSGIIIGEFVRGFSITVGRLSDDKCEIFINAVGGNVIEGLPAPAVKFNNAPSLTLDEIFALATWYEMHLAKCVDELVGDRQTEYAGRWPKLAGETMSASQFEKCFPGIDKKYA